MYTIEFYRNESNIDGRGLFAAERIPKGTIVYYYGSGDSYILKNDFQLLPPDKKEKFYRYAVEDEAGNWLMTNGDANHSCDSNILSLFVDGIYCDIAVKDINIDDEITIDYGLFFSSIPWSMSCNCRSPLCRKTILNGFFADVNTQTLWFSRIYEASSRINKVKQKLFDLDDEKAKELTKSLKSKLSPIVFPYIKFSLISSSSTFFMDKYEANNLICRRNKVAYGEL